MKIKGIIVMIFILIIYFAINAAVYFLVLKLFAVDRIGVKIFLGAAIAVFSASFVGAAILARSSNSLVVRLLYEASAFWMGYVAMLGVFLTGGLFVYFLARAVGVDPRFWIGAASVTLATVYAFWGVWNAKHPVISDIDIGIRNLPRAWERKKVLQVSDVHLGRSNGKSFAETIVAKINDENPDLVFITGDLFDGMGSSVDEFLPILEKINSSQGIFFITGNHEGYLGSRMVVEKLKKTKIRVLENELVEIDGVQIIGLSYPEYHDSQDKENILKEIAGFDSAKPNILLYHVPISLRQRKKDMAQQQSQAYWKPDTDYSLAKESGIDLQLSGHTHAGQFFPFTWIGKMIFNGFNYGLITDGDFSLYISSGTGTWGPPIRTVHKSEIVRLGLRNK